MIVTRGLGSPRTGSLVALGLTIASFVAPPVDREQPTSITPDPLSALTITDTQTAPDAPTMPDGELWETLALVDGTLTITCTADMPDAPTMPTGTAWPTITLNS